MKKKGILLCTFIMALFVMPLAGYCEEANQETVPVSFNSITETVIYINSLKEPGTYSIKLDNSARQYQPGDSSSVALSNALKQLNRSEIYISLDLYDSSIIIQNNLFMNCNALISVILPSNATFIGYEAFSCCRSLESVTIPANITSIKSLAFSGCTSLKSAIFENPDEWVRGTEPILAKHLKDPSEAALYLRNKYTTGEWQVEPEDYDDE